MSSDLREDNATLTQPLPCPWCGHSGITIRDGSTFRWRVAECNNCGACIGEERHNTTGEDQLVEEIKTGRRCLDAWNTRARAPMELTDSEWAQLYAAMDTARNRAFYHNEPEDACKYIANAARQWLAERSGG